MVGVACSETRPPVVPQSIAVQVQPLPQSTAPRTMCHFNARTLSSDRCQIGQSRSGAFLGIEVRLLTFSLLSDNGRICGPSNATTGREVKKPRSKGRWRRRARLMTIWAGSGSGKFPSSGLRARVCRQLDWAELRASRSSGIEAQAVRLAQLSSWYFWQPVLTTSGGLATESTLA